VRDDPPSLEAGDTANSTGLEMSAPGDKPKTAKVEAALAGERFRVVVEETGEKLICHVPGKSTAGIVRLLPGDRVLVEVSPFDSKLGRILEKR